ncbi:MAG: 3-dehydroquinate synthase [Microscillaceae bacterium]|nr:3-dehydroquinate synthase [Microscillaceae bacterium]
MEQKLDPSILWQNPLPALGQWIQHQAYSQIWVLTDENTDRHCWPRLQPFLPDSARRLCIASGEAQKNLSTCTYLWQQLTEAEADRSALWLNLGGGVIGDMGGFCAATYKRGIDFVQIPTTLLAQVDASVGGKLGVDFQGFKNHVGLFALPQRVVIEPAFLQTLPFDELRAGFAEIIKHCLIRDVAQWNNLQKMYGADFWKAAQNGQLDVERLRPLVLHSVALKAEVVAKDPREQGLRKILNFGHTLGHALESYLLSFPHRQVRHGEAVAAGLWAEAWLSQSKTGFKTSEFTQIATYLRILYPKILWEEEEEMQVAALTRQDKKNQAGQIKACLLEKIGQARYDVPLSLEEVASALRAYREHG